MDGRIATSDRTRMGALLLSGGSACSRWFLPVTPLLSPSWRSLLASPQ